MKLLLAIVHSDDADALIHGLEKKGHRCTKISTTGGFLREGNATILIGTEVEKVDEVLSIVQQSCHSRTKLVSPVPPAAEANELYLPRPLEVQVGGATVFVLDVERGVRF